MWNWIEWSFAKKALIGLFFFVSLQWVSISTNAALLDDEINDYIDIFENRTFSAQRAAIGSLVGAGISSPRLYDVIEKKLQEVKSIRKGEGLQQAAWYAKALALSGNEKYRATLTELVEGDYHKKIKRHAKNSLLRLEKYSRWNPEIAVGLADAREGNIENYRVDNMLAAKDYEVVKLGAKRVYYGKVSDPKFYEKIAGRLNDESEKINESDGMQLDAMAWMIKALGASQDQAHLPLLERLAEEASSTKVRRYAKETAKLFK